MYYEVKQIRAAAYQLAKNCDAMIPKSELRLHEQRVLMRAATRFKNTNRHYTASTRVTLRLATAWRSSKARLPSS